MKYTDYNFRKSDGHILTPTGGKLPTKIYSYETKTKLYDIIVASDGRHICRVNSRKCECRAAHHEIDKFYNLGLKLL
jgi:hypothetical protein